MLWRELTSLHLNSPLSLSLFTFHFHPSTHRHRHRPWPPIPFGRGHHCSSSVDCLHHYSHSNYPLVTWLSATFQSSIGATIEIIIVPNIKSATQHRRHSSAASLPAVSTIAIAIRLQPTSKDRCQSVILLVG